MVDCVIIIKPTIDIEVSRLAFGFQKVCIVLTSALPQHTPPPQYCVVFSYPTGSMLFKQQFHKSRKTYQLTNEYYNLQNFQSH